MKSTNNPQTTEDMNKGAITLTEPDCIIEELSDEAASAVSGGSWPVLNISGEESLRLLAQGGGIG